MKIILSGATGLIGQALIKRLLGKHELVVFTRCVPKAIEQFKGAGIQFADWHHPPSHLAALIDGSHALINLAGAGIGDGRWTTKRRKAILWSRVQTIEMLHTLLSAAEMKLKVVIQASAVGYYGFDHEKTFTENDNAGTGFLAEVTKRWEQAALSFEEITERLIRIRSGLVLDSKGGVLPKMAFPFKWFAGGKTGNGKQWVSWIDIEDEVEAILFLLYNNHSNGIYNLVSPEPIQQKHLAQAIAGALNRPYWLTTPSLAIKIALGKMGEELLLKGTKVIPERLVEEGFKFQFTNIRESVNDKLRKY